MFVRTLLTAGALLLTGTAAHAASGLLTGTFNVTVSEGLTNGAQFDTTMGNPFAAPSNGSNTAAAAFTYTGALNFSNTAPQNGPGPSGDTNAAFGFSTTNISNYSGSGTVVYNGTQVARYGPPNDTTTGLANFLASSGSSSGFDYGSYYTIDLGTLSMGTTLTITHDDGISVFQGSNRIGSSASGATSVTTDTIYISTTGDTMLRYARENGTPSVLQVTAVTPEPSSMVLLGTGLLGVAGVIRKRFAA